jgi:hypothetical protein
MLLSDLIAAIAAEFCAQGNASARKRGEGEAERREAQHLMSPCREARRAL